MKRAEFEWGYVLCALHNADLSDALDERGYVKSDPFPAWPSAEFEALFYELRRRVIAPPKQPKRAIGITVAELEAAVDELLRELAETKPPCPEAAKRWELAAAWLLEAIRRARQTKAAPSVFKQ